MVQLVSLTEEQDGTLMGVAARMARQMEAGQRSFVRDFQTDAGSVVFQQLPSGMVRALVTSESDGLFVVGNDSNCTGAHPLMWVGKKKPFRLPTPVDNTSTYALFVSKGGKTISGMYSGHDALGPCVWEKIGGNYVFAVLPGGANDVVTGMSSDGKFISGFTQSGYPQACLWAKGEETPFAQSILQFPASMADVGTLYSTAANGISLDSSVVVGFVYGSLPYIRPCVWRNNVISLLPFSSANVQYATDVSADGLVICGWGRQDSDPWEPCVWEGGIRYVLPHYGRNNSPADVISGDGRVILSTGYQGDPPCAWRDRVLVNLPLPAGLSSYAANGISHTGIIVGVVVVGCLQKACKWTWKSSGPGYNTGAYEFSYTTPVVGGSTSSQAFGIYSKT